MKEISFHKRVLEKARKETKINSKKSTQSFHTNKCVKRVDSHRVNSYQYACIYKRISRVWKSYEADDNFYYVAIASRRKIRLCRREMKNVSETHKRLYSHVIFNVTYSRRKMQDWEEEDYGSFYLTLASVVESAVSFKWDMPALDNKCQISYHQLSYQRKVFVHRKAQKTRFIQFSQIMVTLKQLQNSTHSLRCRYKNFSAERYEENSVL